MTDNTKRDPDAATEVCHHVVCDARCAFPACMGPEDAVPTASALCHPASNSQASEGKDE